MLAFAALDIVQRPKSTPIHELERYMRCKDCSQVRGYPYGDRSTFADPEQHLMIGGQPLETAAGKIVAIHADGIASDRSQLLASAGDCPDRYRVGA